jgi:hypothetical protein
MKDKNMKFFTTAATLLLISSATASFAHEGTHGSEDETCIFVGQVGEYAMTNRQAGAHIDDVINSIRASGQDLSVQQIYTDAVRAAYALPILEDEGDRGFEVLRFGEQLSAECFDQGH